MAAKPKTAAGTIEFPITNRWTGAVQFTATIAADETTTEGVKIGLAVRWAIENRANLSGANLSDAYLSGANLSGANLSDAYLSGANLSGAYLSDAYLSGANLSGAYLSGANLSDAYLSGAYLRGAYLSDAYLSGAYLSDANLSGANLSGANLSDAYLSGANLSGANLSDAYLSGEKITRIFARVQREIDPYTFMGVELEAGGCKIAAGCRWYSLAEFRAHVASDYPDTDKATETLAILDFIAARAAALGIALEPAAAAEAA